MAASTAVLLATVACLAGAASVVAVARALRRREMPAGPVLLTGCAVGIAGESVRLLCMTDRGSLDLLVSPYLAADLARALPRTEGPPNASRTGEH